jgi:hypothetical protein
MAVKTDEVVKFVPNSRDLKGLFGAFRAMDDEGKAQVKEIGREYSDLTARRIAAASPLSVYPRQSAIVAASIRKTTERLPLVAIGGPKGQTSGGARAGNLVFGNEFGASRYPNTNKFPSRSPKQGRGSKGWWIFPTLKEIQPDLLRQWKDDIKKITDKWA